MHVLLATSRDWPAGEPGSGLLTEALAARGLSSRWVAWDDDGVDWAAADLVAVRSTWDYVGRAEEFLAWAGTLDQSRLLNGADVFAWNHDKRYLTELAGMPVVPTVTADDRAALSEAVRAFGPSVVKPRVGAGGVGLLVVTDPEDPRLGTEVGGHPLMPVLGGPWVVQPLVESIRSDGETSVFVVGGELTCQVDKLPVGDEVRVHEHFGGSSRVVPVGEQPGAVAQAAHAALTARFGRPLDYLRVDLLRWQGEWAVSELELIEPGLYLDVTPVNAAPFSQLVVNRLHSLGSSAKHDVGTLDTRVTERHR